MAAELDSSEKDITVSLKVHGESLIFLTGSAHTVGTKPQRFFTETPFGGISLGMAGSCENSSGQKIRFFLARTPWRGIIMTFSLPWRGICTFWQEFVHFG